MLIDGLSMLKYGQFHYNLGDIITNNYVLKPEQVETHAINTMWCPKIMCPTDDTKSLAAINQLGKVWGTLFPEVNIYLHRF